MSRPPYSTFNKDIKTKLHALSQFQVDHTLADREFSLCIIQSAVDHDIELAPFTQTHFPGGSKTYIRSNTCYSTHQTGLRSASRPNDYVRGWGPPWKRTHCQHKTLFAAVAIRGVRRRCSSGLYRTTFSQSSVEVAPVRTRFFSVHNSNLNSRKWLKPWIKPVVLSACLCGSKFSPN